MKILFAGSPKVAADILSGLVIAGHEVVAVLTREDAPVGRKRVMTQTDVATVASDLGIPVIKANRLGAEDVKFIAATGAEIGVVVAYGSILSKEALASLSSGWFNLHFSLLPKFRGAAPVQRAIQNGETETGVSLFRLDEGMDTGPVIGTVRTVIGVQENSGELLKRLGELGLTLLLEELPKIYAGMQIESPQSGESSLATKPTREQARIDFNDSATTVENLIRAMNPEPMAWCTANGEILRVLVAREARHDHLNEALAISQPGELLLFDGRIFVKCGYSSVLELIELQPSSKRPMAARDWFNGNQWVEALA